MPISIKLQKILMFIPGLNYALFLVAYYNMFYVEELTGKQLVIGVVECIPVIVIEDLFYRIIASGFWRAVCFYLCGIAWGLIFIRLQKKCGAS